MDDRGRRLEDRSSRLNEGSQRLGDSRSVLDDGSHALDDRRRTQRAVIHGEMAWWSPQFLLDLRILIPVNGLGVGDLGDVFVHHHISVLQVFRENEFLE